MPPSWQFDTQAQRLDWARRRYFEDGVRPTGLVSEAVLQSWARCQQARLDPLPAPAFNPVSAGRVHDLLARHRQLLQAAADEMLQLQHTLAGTQVVALLLNAGCMVLQASRLPDRSRTPLLAAAARPGVDLSEVRIGTNAPALAARSGGACVVRGSEHYASAIAPVHCAAAAIRGPDGRVAAVLDLSIEGAPFGFDAAQVAQWHAQAIENRLLLSSAGTRMVLRLHLQPAQLDSPQMGLAGLDDAGRLTWGNAAAQSTLGCNDLAGRSCDDMVGLPMAALEQLAHREAVRQVQLPNGLQAWLQCAWRRNDAAALRAAPGCPADTTPAGAAADPSATDGAQAHPTARLRDSHQHLVLHALRACGGNVSAAARMLGVSRGLVYRQRRLAAAD